MFAHPRLVSDIILLVGSADKYTPSIKLLYCFSENETLRRPLFLHEGLVEMLLRKCEACISRLNVTAQTAVCALSQLTMCFPNKLDFVRLGYAGRIANYMTSCRCVVIQELACSVLTGCIRDETDEEEDEEEEEEDAGGGGGGGDDYDGLRQEFFHTPGLVTALVTSAHPNMSSAAFQSLVFCPSLCEEMLAVPGLVDLFTRVIAAALPDADEDATLMTLFVVLTMVRECPVRVLDRPRLIAALANVVNGDSVGQDVNFASACLVDLQLLLGPRPTRPNKPNWRITLEESTTFDFWSNLPRLWTVISVQRVKQRSPLRRLPVEMFRLLRETLCGNGGVRSYD